jgi:6-phosphofructokinase
VVVAEGAQPLEGQMVVHNQQLDAFGHVRLGGIGQWLAEQLEAKTGKEARTVVLGHIQRGGTPSAFDRVLATRYGIGAIDMVHRGESGTMAALRGNHIVSVPLSEALAKNRKVDPEMIEVAKSILDTTPVER